MKKNKSSIWDVSAEKRQQLKNAGTVILNFVNAAYKKDKIKYLLIIEGQASRDSYSQNHQLSYERALALFNFWERSGILFDTASCEVIIAGSGIQGVPRDKNEEKNQRFLIHIIPKTGVIE